MMLVKKLIRSILKKHQWYFWFEMKQLWLHFFVPVLPFLVMFKLLLVFLCFMANKTRFDSYKCFFRSSCTKRRIGCNFGCVWGMFLWLCFIYKSTVLALSLLYILIILFWFELMLLNCQKMHSEQQNILMLDLARAKTQYVVH